MSIKTVARFVGIALLFSAGFMFISLIVSMLNRFDSSFTPLLISTTITFVAGIFPILFVRNNADISIKDGFLIIVCAWILSCIFGMLPYVLWGGEFTLINAWFESVSGFTTSGSTILKDIEALPRGLLFWRSSTHFIGGIGVVIFMLMVLPTMSTFRFKMSKMEISSLSKENYKYRTKELVRIIATVYITLTVLGIIALLIAGMPFFDAICHSFSMVGTGGFSTKNLSIKAFDSVAIEMVIMVFMVLGGLHFGLMYASIVSRKPLLFKSPIIRFYLLSLLISGLLVSAYIYFNGSVEGWWTSCRYAFFQVVSVASTTGFSSTDSTVWPLFTIVIMIYLSIQCACSGSTTGGLKADRIWIFLQSLKIQTKKQLHPNAVLPIRVGKMRLEPEMVSSVNLYIVLYMGFVMLGFILYSTMGMDLMDSFSASISGMGNIGHGFGTIGNQSNYSLFPLAGKLLFTLQMLLGRLEIYPILMIFVIFKKGY